MFRLVPIFNWALVRILAFWSLSLVGWFLPIFCSYEFCYIYFGNLILVTIWFWKVRCSPCTRFLVSLTFILRVGLKFIILNLHKYKIVAQVLLFVRLAWGLRVPLFFWCTLKFICELSLALRKLVLTSCSLVASLWIISLSCVFLHNLALHKFCSCFASLEKFCSTVSNPTLAQFYLILNSFTAVYSSFSNFLQLSLTGQAFLILDLPIWLPELLFHVFWSCPLGLFLPMEFQV